MDRKPRSVLFKPQTNLRMKRGMKATAELLKEEAIRQMETMESFTLEIRHPGSEMRGKTAVGTLTRFREDGGEGLKMRMASINTELIKSHITILMLLDNLTHRVLTQEASTFVLQKSSKKTRENVQDILANIIRKISIPHTKREIVVKSMSRGNKNTKVQMVANKTRVPCQERLRGIVVRKIISKMLDKFHVEPAIEGTQEEGFVLKLKTRGNGMAENNTIVRARSRPGGQ